MNDPSNNINGSVWTETFTKHLSVFETCLSQLAPEAFNLYSPPVLARNPPHARPMAVANLEAAESKVGPILSSIDSLLADLNDLRHDLSRRRARGVNARSPATALPEEILREIFLIVTRIDSANHPAINLSHVCHTWREVCVSDHDLWTTISLPMHPERMELYAKHARNSAVTLECRDDPLWTCECSRCVQHRGSRQLFPVSHEMKSVVRSFALDFSVSDASSDQRVERQIDEILYGGEDYTSLETIDLRLHHKRFPTRDFVTPFFLTLRAYPRVQNLTLQGALANLGSIALTLKNLTFTLPLQGHFVNNVMSQLEECRNLESLHIRSTQGRGFHSNDELLPTSFPSLHTLDLAYMNQRTARDFLARIHAPQLETLKLCEIDGPYTELFDLPDDIHARDDLLCQDLSTLPETVSELTLGGKYLILIVFGKLARSSALPAGLSRLRRLVLGTPSEDWTGSGPVKMDEIKADVEAFCARCEGEGPLVVVYAGDPLVPPRDERDFDPDYMEDL